jgi:tetratricopeptide (TPR) repeat protein
VSFYIVITPFFFSAIVFAQFGPAGAEQSLSGEVQSNGSISLDKLYVELCDTRTHQVVERTTVLGDGSFRFNHGGDASYSVRVVTGPVEFPLVEETRLTGPGNPLVLRLPEQKTDRPPAGGISLNALQHPIPKKAIRAVVEAQRYSESHDTANAIAKLEQAVRIAPAFRDAHANLGVLYARAGRLDEAVAQFQSALAVGPPNALIYSNLSLALLTLKQYRDGEASARSALALDPRNDVAQKLLRFAAAH